MRSLSTDLAQSSLQSLRGGMAMTIKEKQILQLLKLEQLFHSHYMTEELLNETISMYVRLVEQISETKHPLKVYFMEKIKFVLSRPEILSILEKETASKNQTMRETIKGVIGVSQEEELAMKKLAEEAKEEIRQNHLINLKKDRQYEKTAMGEELKDKERNMKIEMQMKIMEEVEQNMQKITQDFKKADQLRQKNEEEIKGIVSKQDETLSQRLANRKKKLRKKSVDLNDKEVIQAEPTPPIKMAELLEVQKELNQTYERFTRLTASKTRMGTNQRARENEGRVKIKIEESPLEDEELFEVEPKHKPQIKMSFKKKEKEHHPTPIHTPPHTPPQKPPKIQTLKDENFTREQGTTVEYKPFEQNKGRVTMRQKQWQQIEDEQLL